MKWLSIKEYLPPACTDVFIRVITKFDDCSFNRYFIGMIENFNKIDKLSAWEMANGQYYGDVDSDDYQVTHFAIPDAVAREE